jgi:hypothetical protein
MEEIDQNIQRAKSLTSEILEKIKEEGNLIQQKALKMIEANIDPTSDDAQELLDENYHFSNCQTPFSKEKFVEFSKFNLQNLRNCYDEIHPKCAEFIEKALAVWAKRNL